MARLARAGLINRVRHMPKVEHSAPQALWLRPAYAPAGAFLASGDTGCREQHGDNLIDRHVVDKLNRLKISPSPLAGDEEFLRRVFLDLIGVQPKPEEVQHRGAASSLSYRRVASLLAPCRSVTDG